MPRVTSPRTTWLEGVPYKDLGADHFARRDEKKAVGRLTRRIEELGDEVEIKKKVA